MMTRTKLRAAGIVALKPKAHLARQVALEQCISHDETLVPSEDNVIRFSFEPMGDVTGDSPPPGVLRNI